MDFDSLRLARTSNLMFGSEEVCSSRLVIVVIVQNFLRVSAFSNFNAFRLYHNKHVKTLLDSCWLRPAKKCNSVQKV